MASREAWQMTGARAPKQKTVGPQLGISWAPRGISVAALPCSPKGVMRSGGGRRGEGWAGETGTGEDGRGRRRRECEMCQTTNILTFFEFSEFGWSLAGVWPEFGCPSLDGGGWRRCAGNRFGSVRFQFGKARFGATSMGHPLGAREQSPAITAIRCMARATTLD